MSFERLQVSYTIALDQERAGLVGGGVEDFERQRRRRFHGARSPYSHTAPARSTAGYAGC